MKKNKNITRRLAMFMAVAIFMSLIVLPFGANFAMAASEDMHEKAIKEAHDAMVMMQDGAKEKWEALAKEGVENAETYAKFCETWEPDEDSHVFRDAVNYDPKLKDGTFWLLNDCFVYVPNTVNADTKCLVHFAGAYSGWMLRQDYVQTYLREYSPNAVMIFYKASFVNNRRHLHERTVDILKAVSAQTGWAPQDISVTGSSNGGYSALYLAALIMKDFNIRAENVLILDMGNLWCYTELLISKEEAAPMIDANTTVYAFSKVNNIYGTAPSRNWLTYGVHTMEVACVNWDHDGITKMALRNGTLSWAIGEQDELDPDWYTINPIDPSYTTVT